MGEWSAGLPTPSSPTTYSRTRGTHLYTVREGIKNDFKGDMSPIRGGGRLFHTKRKKWPEEPYLLKQFFCSVTPIV